MTDTHRNTLSLGFPGKNLHRYLFFSILVPNRLIFLFAYVKSSFDHCKALIFENVKTISLITGDPPELHFNQKKMLAHSGQFNIWLANYTWQSGQFNFYIWTNLDLSNILVNVLFIILANSKYFTFQFQTFSPLNLTMNGFEIILKLDFRPSQHNFTLQMFHNPIVWN